MESILPRFFTFVPVETLVTLTMISLIVFLTTLIIIPFILIRLPADYFDTRVPRTWLRDHHPALRYIGRLVKNLIGVVFLFAGLAMLVLPGQGLLTILVGISLLDFPGKQKVEARIVGQPTVLGVINAIRHKFGKPPLVVAPASSRQT